MRFPGHYLAIRFSPVSALGLLQELDRAQIVHSAAPLADPRAFYCKLSRMWIELKIPLEHLQYLDSKGAGRLLNTEFVRIGEHSRNGFGPIRQGPEGVHGRLRDGARFRSNQILPRHINTHLAHTPGFPSESGSAGLVPESTREIGMCTGLGCA